MKIYYFAYLVLTMAFVFMIIIIYWLVAPYKIITFNTKEHKIITPIVKRGENLAYITNRCKLLPLIAKVSRVFLNDLEFPVPGFTYSKVDIGCLVEPIYYTVPKELPLGSYQLKTIYHYFPNPIRNIDYIMYTERFEVIE